MAQLSATKTARGTDPKVDPKDDNKLTKDDVRNDKQIENSTDEFLGVNQANRGEYDPQDEQTQFDAQAVENATHSNEVGHASYSAGPEDIKDDKPAGAGGGKGAAWAGKHKSDKEAMMTVKLLKDYGPGPTSKHEWPEGVGKNYTVAGKVPAGTHISLPKDEALRFIKLGSAEAAEDQK